jgi:peptidoglycan hydrolase-like amidase
MMKRLATLFIALPLAAAGFGPREQAEPTVRIALNQNASAVAVRSSQAFTVEQNRTRSARFSIIVSVDPAVKSIRKEDLQYRMLIELDGGRLLTLPMSSKVRMEPSGAWMDFDNRSYRGILEVFGNSRNTFTVVNELPMEEYLLGVVPNELGPKTFGQLEALKAQAVAARTYIVRNMGQYRRDGFDIRMPARFISAPRPKIRWRLRR